MSRGKGPHGDSQSDSPRSHRNIAHNPNFSHDVYKVSSNLGCPDTTRPINYSLLSRSPHHNPLNWGYPRSSRTPARSAIAVNLRSRAQLPVFFCDGMMLSFNSGLVTQEQVSIRPARCVFTCAWCAELGIDESVLTVNYILFLFIPTDHWRGARIPRKPRPQKRLQPKRVVHTFFESTYELLWQVGIAAETGTDLDLTGTDPKVDRDAEPPVPALMLTFPTPEIPKSPVFAPQSPFTVHKFVAASAGNDIHRSPNLHPNPAATPSLIPVISGTSPVPSLPQCTRCGFGLDPQSTSSTPTSLCHQCEKQWLACKLWYHSRDGGRGRNLKEPYVRPGESNAGSRAVTRMLGLPVGSPRGLGIEAADGIQTAPTTGMLHGSWSGPRMLAAEESLEECDEFAVIRGHLGSDLVQHGVGSTLAMEGYSRFRALRVNTGPRRKALWRKVTAFFTLGHRRHVVEPTRTDTPVDVGDRGRRRQGLDLLSKR